MSVIVMKVKKAEKHPNAETLRLYQFKAHDVSIQVIANLENVYQVDDKVAVALVGSVLKDGTEIKRAKLRGIPSFGMALGKVEMDVGVDLSTQYCSETKIQSPGSLVKWPSIEGLHYIRRGLKVQSDMEGFSYPTITYKSKVKLHGTNAGVQVTTDGQVIAQGRNRVLTIKDDNIGFAKWVESNRDYLSALKSDKHIIIFGEWSGQGIQKGVAISEIKRKVFAVFAIQFGTGQNNSSTLVCEPEEIQRILGVEPADIFVLPWYNDHSITLEYGTTEQLSEMVAEINKMVVEVEQEDPWVAQTFGIKGTGEGLVFYPVGNRDRDWISEYMFKAKGDKHKIVKQKAPVQLDPEIAENINEFVNMVLTPARYEQAVVEACESKYEIKLMGKFLKWIGQDVKKESIAELEASSLEWKQVSKMIATTARNWYKEQVETFSVS